MRTSVRTLVTVVLTLTVAAELAAMRPIDEKPRWWLEDGIVFVGNWEPLAFRLRRGRVAHDWKTDWEWQHRESTIDALETPIAVIDPFGEVRLANRVWAWRYRAKSPAVPSSATGSGAWYEKPFGIIGKHSRQPIASCSGAEGSPNSTTPRLPPCLTNSG